MVEIIIEGVVEYHAVKSAFPVECIHEEGQTAGLVKALLATETGGGSGDRLDQELICVRMIYVGVPIKYQVCKIMKN